MDNPHLGINDRSAISSATLNGSCGSGGGGDTDSVGLRRSHGGGSPYGHHHHLSTGGSVAGGSHIVTVIVHKDENGYGMKVSGDNPVYVQSVKEGGAASKAGLYPGDKIIKVNGEDVIKSMHTDVVALIRSSTHVTLTVQQRHSSVLHHYHHPGVGGAGTARPLSASLHHHTRITGPQPVDNEKLREFENERVHTFRLMLEKEQRYVEQLRSDLATCGASAATKVATDLANAERNVATLQTQLQNLLHAHSELSASSSLSNTLPKPIISTNNFQNSMPHSKSDNQITEKPPPLPERNRPVKSVDHGNLDIVKTAPIKNLDQKSIFSDESQNLNRLKNFTPPKKNFPKARKEINSNSLSPRVCSPSKFIVENQLYHDLVDSHNNLREKRLRQTSPPIPMSPKCQNARPYTSGSPDGSVPPPLPPRVPMDNKCPPAITTTSSGCSEVDPDAVNSINKQMSYPLIATCAALVNHSCSTKSPHIVNKHHRTKSSPDPLTPHISPKDATKKLLASESMSDLSENVPVQASSDSWEMVSPDSADRVTPPGTPPPPYPSPCMSRNPNMSGRSISVSGGSSQRSSGEHSDGAFVEEGPPGFADNVAEMLPPILATSSPIMAATSNVVQQPIISMEDELSDQEMEQIENHGPFKSLSRLLEHLGHLAVFMNYILSNCDPSSILFYLLTDLYKRDKTQAKDLKKWAYEIHSTFLVPGAPLRLNNVDENIAREIDDALANESDKEEILKKVFWKARSRAKEELTERLAEFRQKRSAGLGTMYGPNDAQLEESINDKLKEAKIAEDLLLKKLDGYIEDIERDPPDPRRFSIAAALATICSRMFNFRQHPVLDRCPTFVSKDKNFKIKFIGKSRKLNHRGHHFLAHQYYTVTYCNNCQLHIWGIGPQAYQCSNCNTNVHRHCVRSFEENCPGPVVKKDRGGDAISKFMGRIRSDSRITGDGSRRKASGNFLIAERDRRLQEEGGDEVNNDAQHDGLSPTATSALIKSKIRRRKLNVQRSPGTVQSTLHAMPSAPKREHQRKVKSSLKTVLYGRFGKKDKLETVLENCCCELTVYKRSDFDKKKKVAGKNVPDVTNDGENVQNNISVPKDCHNNVSLHFNNLNQDLCKNTVASNCIRPKDIDKNIYVNQLYCDDSNRNVEAISNCVEESDCFNDNLKPDVPCNIELEDETDGCVLNSSYSDNSFNSDLSDTRRYSIDSYVSSPNNSINIQELDSTTEVYDLETLNQLKPDIKNSSDICLNKEKYSQDNLCNSVLVCNIRQENFDQEKNNKHNVLLRELNPKTKNQRRSLPNKLSDVSVFDRFTNLYFKKCESCDQEKNLLDCADNGNERKTPGDIINYETRCLKHCNRKIVTDLDDSTVLNNLNKKSNFDLINKTVNTDNNSQSGEKFDTDSKQKRPHSETCLDSWDCTDFVNSKFDISKSPPETKIGKNKEKKNSSYLSWWTNSSNKNTKDVSAENNKSFEIPDTITLRKKPGWWSSNENISDACKTKKENLKNLNNITENSTLEKYHQNTDTVIINQNNVLDKSNVDNNRRKASWWSSNEHGVITTLQELESQTEPEKQIEQNTKKQNALKNRFSDSNLLMTYRQSFKNKFIRRHTQKDAKSMPCIGDVIKNNTQIICTPAIDQKITPTKPNNQIKRTNSKTRMNSVHRERHNSTSSNKERKNSFKEPQNTSTKKSKSKKFSYKKKGKSEITPPKIVLESDDTKPRKKSESLENVSTSGLIYDESVVFRSPGSVPHDRKQKSNSNLGVNNLVDNTVNVFGRVSSNRPTFSKSKSYSSINLNLLRSRRKLLKDTGTNNQRCENEFQFIAFGGITANHELTINRKFAETLQSVNENSDSGKKGMKSSKSSDLGNKCKNAKETIKHKVSHNRTSWLRSKKSSSSANDIPDIKINDSGERVFPSAPVSRTGSDRRSDASETPDTPEQEQDSATDHSHDSVHGIQKPKSAQSSINRSESYKEQSQKKRQHRERRKISDPNLSKSHDVEPDAHGLSYHTNSGSSSSSSLSSTRSLDTPSTSLDTVPALGTISRGAGESDPETERISDPADWASAVPDELLARLAPCEKKRQEVFNELLQTERSHVRQLRVLERVFHRPLRENLLLPAEQLSLMFPNLERMLDLHATFSAAMKALRRDSPLVADVGPVLLSMFDGTSGEAFERAATEFCARQQIALDWLRERRRKDAKLHSFLTECEADKLCRRLQLKDLIPMGIQRLTKYPLLFENLAKYTAQCLNDSNSANQLMQDELEKVQRAVERSREIVKKVNAAVKEAEDFAKLQDIQKRLDKSSLERAEHPEFTAFKNIDLTKHKLIHEGPLSWRPAPNKKISLYVLLLEDMIMLLQKQDDKYSLKFHGNPSLSPIIRVCNAIVRPNAADQNSIYLINGACNVAQMYELVAQSPSESRMWFKHISEATDAYRKREGLLGRFALPTPVDNQEQDGSSDDRNVDEEEAAEEEGAVATTDQSQDDNTQDGEESEETPETKGLSQGEDGAPAQGNNLGSQNSLNRFGQHSPLRLCTEQSPLIPPSEVHVSNCPVMKAEPVYTPLEQLRRKDELIRQTLLEKQMLVADILCVPHGDFEHIADIAGEQARSREADATELVLAAVTQVGRLSEALNEAVNLTDESAIALTANPVQQKHARLPAVPAHTLQPIVDLLSTELSHLLKRVKERDEEREKLRRELHKSREQIHILNELRRLHPDLMSNSLPNELPGENGRTDPETIKEEPSDCEADLDETQENPKNSNN